MVRRFARFVLIWTVGTLAVIGLDIALEDDLPDSPEILLPAP